MNQEDTEKGPNHYFHMLSLRKGRASQPIDLPPYDPKPPPSRGQPKHPHDIEVPICLQTARRNVTTLPFPSSLTVKRHISPLLRSMIFKRPIHAGLILTGAQMHKASGPKSLFKTHISLLNKLLSEFY